MIRGTANLARRIVACGFAAALAAGAPAASAAEAPIGQIKVVSGDAVIGRGAESVPAKVGGHVFAQDVIRTGANASLGITFVDNTVMSAGPNSEVVLEEYAFDSDNFRGSMQTDVHRGTLSFVSGDIARGSPGAMKVKTPTAILGVRGTRFLVKVGDAP
jgi:hypothetical protein